jgi:hypothetical protein
MIIKLISLSGLFSKIALYLAVSTTLILAPFALLETYIGISDLIDRLTWDAALMSFIGIGGIIGIIGLWMRAFVHPAEQKLKSLSANVTLMLFTGSISALAFGGTIVYALLSDNDATEISVGVFRLMFFFLSLGIFGLLIAVQNYLASNE